jgi:hypothetical protein
MAAKAVAAALAHSIVQPERPSHRRVLAIGGNDEIRLDGVAIDVHARSGDLNPFRTPETRNVQFLSAFEE